MNEEQTLSDTQIFTQLVHCDECDESLFQISEVFENDISIKCGECGARFTVYAEKADEVITKNLLQQGQARGDRSKLSELLEIRLHAFEDQIGHGEGAVLFFETFIKSILAAVTESIDSDILEELRTLFFRRIKDSGMDEGQELFLLDVETAATRALERSDYEQVDDERSDYEQVDDERETED